MRQAKNNKNENILKYINIYIYAHILRSDNAAVWMDLLPEFGNTEELNVCATLLNKDL